MKKDLSKIICYVAVTVMLILFIIYLTCYAYESYENSLIPTVTFPFKNLFDDRGNKLNIILLAAPFRTVEDEQKYETYKKQGLRFCGISSYLDYPNKINNPYEDQFHVQRGHDYTKMADAWLNCFRIPSYIEKISHLPHMLLTEADLKDTSEKMVVSEKKEYDFLYCCLSDNDQCTPGWQSYNRNWELAKKCLEIMCNEFHLRGVLVGRKNCEFSNRCDGIVKVLPFLPYHEFQAELKKCRFLFVPNVSDASPRVISEAILYDMPVLVNEHILGGWHNIIPGVTGEFFTNENDISNSIRRMLTNMKNNSYTPSEWYRKNRGKNISGVQLAEFLIKHFPDINHKKMKYATITI
jgi:hypothetical protein